MKKSICLLFLVFLTSALAQASDEKLFYTVFIENGAAPLNHPETKNLTIGKYYSQTIYMDSHAEAPKFTCTDKRGLKVCTILWLSGNYKALDEAQSKKLPAELLELGAPFLQTTDCGRSLEVTLKKTAQSFTVTSAKLLHEACGGYGGDF